MERVGTTGLIRSCGCMYEVVCGAYGDEAAVFGMVAEPEVALVSNLVIVKPDGNFPDPLCFLFLAIGPEGPLGEAGRDKFLGVIVEALDDTGGIAKGLFEVAIGNEGLKLCCKPCKSVVENDCLNIFGIVEAEPAVSAEKTPAPGTEGAFGRVAGSCCTDGGALCVLWSSVIIIGFVSA